MKPITTNKRKLLHHYGPFLQVEEHEVAFPDGTVIPDWTWVITPDFINVTAVTPDGQFVLFRQTKYAIKDTTLAPVGGYMETGEDPLEAAKRELREETGYTSDEWTPLGAFPVDANRGVATGHFFLATNATFASKGESDDLEEQELILLSETEVREALASGAFKVMSWVACMHLGLAALEPSSSAS